MLTNNNPQQGRKTPSLQHGDGIERKHMGDPAKSATRIQDNTNDANDQSGGVVQKRQLGNSQSKCLFCVRSTRTLQERLPPKLKNKDGGNGKHKDGSMPLGMQKRERNQVRLGRKRRGRFPVDKAEAALPQFRLSPEGRAKTYVVTAMRTQGFMVRVIRMQQRRLELPQELSRVHHTFHVSNLKKCYADEPIVMPLEGIHVDDKLQFVEEPVEIMEREIKRLKQSRIPLVKVRWNFRRGLEFTWEREDSFKQKYPQLFTNWASSSTTRT
ncbi:hypothetical protein Tco_0367204 [Tanacetum coccineum]